MELSNLDSRDAAILTLCCPPKVEFVNHGGRNWYLSDAIHGHELRCHLGPEVPLDPVVEGRVDLRSGGKTVLTVRETGYKAAPVQVRTSTGDNELIVTLWLRSRGWKVTPLAGNNWTNSAVSLEYTLILNSWDVIQEANLWNASTITAVSEEINLFTVSGTIPPVKIVDAFNKSKTLKTIISNLDINVK